MQMLKHNLQKWLLLFVKVWQHQSVFKMLFIQAKHSRSLAGKCRMSLLFTVDSVAGFCVLLVPSQEHSPPWGLLAYWERAEVPRLFYNRQLWQDPLYKWRHWTHVTPWGYICSASFASTRPCSGLSIGTLKVDGNEKRGGSGGHSNSGSVCHCGDRGLF